MMIFIPRMMRIICLMCVLCFLCCCEKPKDITLPDHQPKLVLHGYVGTGDRFQVAVGKTATNAGIIVADTALLINNALVVLYEDGVIKDTLDFNSNSNRYESSTILAASGVTYRVTVQAPGFTPVEATATAPTFIPTKSVVRVRAARFDELGNSQDDITFSLADPPAEKNYYLAEINTYQSGTVPNSFCIYTYDPSVDKHQGDLDPFETDNCIDNKALIFTDKLFNGATKELTISTASYNLQNLVVGNRIYRPYLKKYTISDDYFQYINHSITLDVLKDNPFSRPYTIPGNVKNGYGLFTVFSAVIDTLH